MPAPQVIGGGLVLAAAGFATLALVKESSGLPFLIAGSVAYSLGISPSVILATDLIVSSARFFSSATN